MKTNSSMYLLMMLQALLLIHLVLMHLTSKSRIIVKKELECTQVLFHYLRLSKIEQLLIKPSKKIIPRMLKGTVILRKVLKKLTNVNIWNCPIVKRNFIYFIVLKMSRFHFGITTKTIYIMCQEKNSGWI